MMHYSPMQERVAGKILTFLLECKDMCFTPTHIWEGMKEETYRHVTEVLAMLVQDSKIEKVDRGIYRCLQEGNS